MAILSIQDLWISFGGLAALNGISMDVPKGSIFSIIGPNGAGKTTIFNCITGIYRPKKGDVRFEDKSLLGCNPHAVARRGIARTFQNIELFSRLTTMDNLLLGRHIHMRSGVFSGATFLGKRFPAAKEECAHRERVENIIEFLEIESARDIPTAALPYGTRKLVELGRALAMEPSLLLLDEPTAGMNQEEKRDMIYRLRDGGTRYEPRRRSIRRGYGAQLRDEARTRSARHGPARSCRPRGVPRQGIEPGP
jgi:branched-chain amino acid transport system ATP-binding protein